MRNNKGETFAETLVALLIGVMAMLMLVESIVTAARINHKIATDKKLSTVEERGTEAEKIDATVCINDTPVSVTVYKVKDSGFLYYDYPAEISE